MEPTIGKPFKTGQSQAVRIPKAIEFKGVDEVELVQQGNAIVLRPRRKSWSTFAEDVAAMGGADDDFMPERPPLFDPDRGVF